MDQSSVWYYHINGVSLDAMYTPSATDADGDPPCQTATDRPTGVNTVSSGEELASRLDRETESKDEVTTENN